MPNQPIYKDEHGTSRFRANEIVRRLLDDGPFDMNQIALWQGVSDEDRAQFAQLIGYSVSGWGSLSYVTPEQADEADRRALTFSWTSDPETSITFLHDAEWVRYVFHQKSPPGVYRVDYEADCPAWVTVGGFPSIAPRPAPGAPTRPRFWTFIHRGGDLDVRLWIGGPCVSRFASLKISCEEIHD